MSIERRILDLLAERVLLEGGELIQTSHNLRDDLNLDSLDIIELWMELEKDFNIVIPEEMLENLTDVQSAIDMVENILNK